jgi:hypothetical protein
MAGAPAPDPDTYFSRLAKLVPGEALGLYITGASLINSSSSGTGNVNMLLWVLALAGVVLAVVVRSKATRDTQGHAQWGAVMIGVISFALWVASMPEGSRPILPQGDTILYVLLSVIWSAFVPVIYKGD